MTIDLRSTFVAVGRAVGRAWAVMARRWRRGRHGLERGYEALNDLRRRYVFGAISREAFEAGRRSLEHGRHRRRLGTGRGRDVA
jgi:hypothetical protein